MSPGPRTRRAAHRASVLVLATAVVTGCGASDDPGESAASPSAPATTPATTASSPETTATSTPTPDANPPSDVPTPPDPSAPVPGQATLVATDLPAAAGPWSPKPGDEAAAAGLCARFTLLDIGADQLHTVSFAGAESSASHALISAADAKTVSRIAAVLGTWQRDCQAPPKRATAVLSGPITAVSVAVPGATAWWSAVSYMVPAGGAEREETLGVVTRGDRLSVVRLDQPRRPSADADTSAIEDLLQVTAEKMAP